MTTCNSCGAENPPASIYCEDCGAQLQVQESGTRSPADPLEPGTVILERYSIESLLEGGPILRYQAHREGKSFLLLEARRSDETSTLARQKELLSGLSQDGFVVPLDFFTQDGYDYAAAPWPGTRLEDQCAISGAQSPEEVAEILKSVLGKLSVLHQHGLLSRSIQPGRIWRSDDGEILLDLWERTCDLKHSEDDDAVCSVTPGYSAPEMYGLGRLGAHTDLFSLAAVGYFLLTGKKLNLDSRESFFVIDPPQVEGAEDLIKVLMKGLRKTPENRFESAQAMMEALENPGLVEEHVPAPAPAPKPAPVVAKASNGRSAPSGPQVAMYSHVGRVRRINQDACLELRFSYYEKSQRFEAWLVTVIDGMGGEAEGDKAASLALRTIAQEVVASDLSLRDGRKTTVLLPDDLDQRCNYVLERAIQAANRTIFEYASLDESRRGMGCTLTACLLAGNKAYFAQVGDTRGYHGRERLVQITTDHSLVGRLVAMGSITDEEARVSPQRSIIYRALGTNPEVEVDLFQHDVKPGDRLLLCSDGVWEYFEAGEFENLVMVPKSPDDICHHLVNLCLDRGADDNATIAVIQC